MDQRRRLYETTFIINASIEDTHIEGTNTHAQEVITRNGGEVTAVNKWGRKRLAFPIQKKNNGFYVNIEFFGTGTVVSQLQRSFILDQNILRFLIIQVDRRALKVRQEAPTKPETPETAPPPPPETEKKPLFEDEPGRPEKPAVS